MKLVRFIIGVCVVLFGTLFALGIVDCPIEPGSDDFLYGLILICVGNILLIGNAIEQIRGK